MSIPVPMPRGSNPSVRPQVWEAWRGVRARDVQEVVDKILFEHEVFRMDRFLLQLTVGPTPHDKVMHAIELYGTKVAPAVRKVLVA